MTLELLKDSLPDYAKDIRLNLGTVITTAQGLTPNQAFSIALASAYATRSSHVIEMVRGEAKARLSDAELEAAKAASTIMAMNNVYYRAVHLGGDEELSKMPAGLRMQIIGNPGVSKTDFELMSLAVSAVNGCGMCIESHIRQAVSAGVTRQGVQSSLKIAAVLNAAAQASFIETGFL